MSELEYLTESERLQLRDDIIEKSISIYEGYLKSDTPTILEVRKGLCTIIYEHIRDNKLEIEVDIEDFIRVYLPFFFINGDTDEIYWYPTDNAGIKKRISILKTQQKSITKWKDL